MPLNAGVFNYQVNRSWATQGFRFIKHNMHGQPKTMATYPGTYSAVAKLDNAVTYKQFEYYEPGEPMRMVDAYDPTTSIATWQLDNPGKEMDLVMEQRAVDDITVDIGLEMDVGWENAAPAPTVSIFPTISISETELSTHVNSKVIRYPIVMKSVETKVDGATSTLENLAFDHQTGQPVLTKTTDGYDGLAIDGSNHSGEVYAFNICGSWLYPELGQRRSDPLYTNQLGVSVGSVAMYGVNPLTTSAASSGTIDLTMPLVQDRILAASAVKMANNWFQQDAHPAVERDYLTPANISTDARDQLNRQWHVQSNYVYHSNRSAAASATKGIADAGYFSDYTPFDWTADDNSLHTNKWIRGSKVVMYSPHAQPLQEVDALDIPSTVRFGYQQQLPILVAANATYDNVLFEDFEYASTTTPTAHSGSNAHYMSQGGTTRSYNLPTLTMDNQLQREGGIVRVWLRSAFSTAADVANNSHGFRVLDGFQSKPMTRVARTGGWDLYEAYLQFPSDDYEPGDALQLSLEYDLAANESVYLDDLRFQPRESQVTCYVYDPDNYRLLTEFGDQHFGVYYQYDLEGKLVRQSIETERGIKTLKETQYNVPRELRNQ